jgi:hypothetical protein
MSDPNRTFLEQYLIGQATVDEIDDFVDRWHAGESTASLADFLGFTASEYASWVENPASLRGILAARQRATTRAAPAS